MSAIIKAVAEVMGKVGSVEKKGKNDFHRYSYATAADIQHKLQPLLAASGLVIFQNEIDRDLMANGAAIAVRYAFTLAHVSGETWPDKPVHTGVAAALNTKGGFDDKCINKTYTAARKYFLLALFQIPTGDYDDADADEDKPKVTAIKPVKKPVEDNPFESEVPAGEPSQDALRLMEAIEDCRSLEELEAYRNSAPFRGAWKALPPDLQEQVKGVGGHKKASLMEREAA